MSISALVWLALAGGLAAAALRRTTYGLSLYLLTFFLFPSYWWWGRLSLPNLRWNLMAGVVLALAVATQHALAPSQTPWDPRARRVGMILLVIAVNATLVHLLFAPSWEISTTKYIQLLKFVLLFFLIVAVIRNPRDLRLVVWSIVLGAAYIGYEVTVNDRGRFVRGRLEGVGAAGVDDANGLASLMVTILPLAGGLFFWGRRLDKLLVAVTGPLILNVAFMCSSRGALLALIGGSATFLVNATGPVRRKAFWGVALGGFATFLLLGDPDILARFTTIFSSEEERDASASGRLVLWRAGLSSLLDNPLGAGGDGFKRFYAWQYLPRVGMDAQGRSVHSGMLNEALEWGIQGWVLRMLFIGSAVLLTRRTLREQTACGNGAEAALGCALIASAGTFLVSTTFGDYMDDEWGYWVPALMIAYARLYGAGATQTVVETRPLVVARPAGPFNRPAPAPQVAWQVAAAAGPVRNQTRAATNPSRRLSGASPSRRP